MSLIRGCAREASRPLAVDEKTEAVAGASEEDADEATTEAARTLRPAAATKDEEEATKC